MPVLLLGYFCAQELPSGPRRRLRDCSRVQVTLTNRCAGRMAPDERRAAKDAGRPQLRPATWQRRAFVDNAVSRTARIFPANPGTAAFLPTIQAMLLRLLTALSARGCRYRRE